MNTSVPAPAKTETAQDIIAKRGGSTAVAKVLSLSGPRVPGSTVASWYQNNKIPTWREKDVLAIPLAEKPKKARAA